MTPVILNKDAMVQNIRNQFADSGRLKYKRALLEFEDNAGNFLGDNVFETSFLLREGQPPLIYEVSGPYDTVSNEYATIGRIYEGGQRVFECDIKDQIQQRTAAMVTLFLEVINHHAQRVLVVGAGKLACETVRYLKHHLPELSELDYHNRTQPSASFEAACKQVEVDAHFLPTLDLSGHDTIILVTNTTECLIHADNFDDIQPGAVVASLCTTSQTGEISPEIYGRGDADVMLDYDLTRRFTPDMRAADDAGYLDGVTCLADLLNAPSACVSDSRRTILRLTGTPMQNVAVLDMMRDLAGV